MLELIKLYWKPLSICALLAIIFGWGYYDGYKHEKMRYEAFVQEIEHDKQIAEIQNAEILKQQQQITTNVAKEYSNAVDKLNSYYANHPHIVRLCNASSTNAVSSESASSTGASQTFSGVTETPAIDLLQASKEIVQCQALIEWELQQGEVK